MECILLHKIYLTHFIRLCFYFVVLLVVPLLRHAVCCGWIQVNGVAAATICMCAYTSTACRLSLHSRRCCLLLLSMHAKLCWPPAVPAVETPDIDQCFSHHRDTKSRDALLGSSLIPRRTSPCSPFPTLPGDVLASCLDSCSKV